jgi:hypothetical protein
MVSNVTSSGAKNKQDMFVYFTEISCNHAVLTLLLVVDDA